MTTVRSAAGAGHGEVGLLPAPVLAAVERGAPAVSPFRDVSTRQRLHQEMARLVQQEVSAGWTEKDGPRACRPPQPVHRGAMAAFLCRTASLGRGAR